MSSICNVLFMAFIRKVVPVLNRNPYERWSMCSLLLPLVSFSVPDSTEKGSSCWHVRDCEDAKSAYDKDWGLGLKAPVACYGTVR